jgi:hypothetical protein
MRDNADRQFCRCTRREFLWESGIAVACGAVFLALAGAAAPVPKEVAADEPADLKSLHALIAKAVKDEKWPSEADEKKIRATFDKLLARISKAGDLEDVKLPADFDTLKKSEVTKLYVNPGKQAATKAFIITGGTALTTASSSVILASGDVDVLRGDNCVIVGRKVRFELLVGSVVIASEGIKGTAVTAPVPKDRRPGLQDRPLAMMIAGEWMRVNVANGAVCHVLRPSTTGAPDDPKGSQLPAITLNTSGDTLLLNKEDDLKTGGGPFEKRRVVVPKSPIAK